MNDWMNPASPIGVTSSAHPSPVSEGTPNHTARLLRGMDIGLSLAAIFLLIALLPLTLWALAISTVQTTRHWGAHQRTFSRWQWRLPDSCSGRLFAALGAQHWPSLLNVLRGDMAWVGPRARRIEEPTSPAAQLAPGLVGLHQLRQATAVDFMSEDASDTEYSLNRSLSHDARLLVLLAFASLGKKNTVGDPRVAERVQILDTTVNNLLMDEALHHVMNAISASRFTPISFVNPACANIAASNPQYRRDLQACDLVLPDGFGMKIASKWLGTPIRQNVNGTDFFPRLCTAMNEQGHRLYLLGARPEVVAQVSQVVRQRWPRIKVVGARHGYIEAHEEASVAQDIQESGAHVVLVAMGVPAQESFIARWGHRMGPCVAMGVGGLFDFVAGRVSRAPQWMRDAGLEWVWRLMQEPGRMWRRYLVGNLTFLLRVALQRAGLRKPRKLAADPQSPTAPESAHKRTAILLADHVCDTDEAGLQLAAALPFGPCSFAEMVVAQLAHHAVRQVHILTVAESPSIQTLESLLGDGSRWGLQIHWHRSVVAQQPYQPLRSVLSSMDCEQPVLLIKAHTWLNSAGVQRLFREPQLSVNTNEQGQIHWQGWACVEPDDLRTISTADSAQSLERTLLDRLNTRYIPLQSECGGAHDRASWLQAQHAVPAAELVALQTDVWVAHAWGYAHVSAHISSHSHIEGPAWIGPDCIVRSDAHIGPHITLCSQSAVDPRTTVSNAVALPGAHISKRTPESFGVCKTQTAQVQPPVLRNPRMVDDSCNRTPVSATRSSRWLGACAAGLLAPVMVLWLMARRILKKGPAWTLERVILGRQHPGGQVLSTVMRQPVINQSRARWLAWYGALLDVAQGRRHWVGIRARRLDQWFALDAPTRAALSFAPIGLWNPIAWTNHLGCVHQVEAAADRLWLARRHVRTASALSEILNNRLSTGHADYRALVVI